MKKRDSIDVVRIATGPPRELDPEKIARELRRVKRLALAGASTAPNRREPLRPGEWALLIQLVIDHRDTEAAEFDDTQDSAAAKRRDLASNLLPKLVYRQSRCRTKR